MLATSSNDSTRPLLGLACILIVAAPFGYACGDNGHTSSGSAVDGAITATGGVAGNSGSGGQAGGPPPCPRCPACGDGILDPGEACDDGNSLPGDGCNGLCQIESNWDCPFGGRYCVKTSLCGDGTVTSDEICDDGNQTDGDGCSADCLRIEPGWSCPVPGQSCSLIPPRDAGVVCGNGVVESAEQCDLGDRNGMDLGAGSCTVACTIGHFCGDGLPDPNLGEECDLGELNGQPQQRCDKSCKIVGEPRCPLLCL